MASTPEAVRLDDLIAAVSQTSDEPLDRLTSAVHMAAQLDEAADALVDHFVGQARGAGASWAQIGGSLGVTRQAAQQRFVGKSGQQQPLDPSQGFSRFTEAARAVVVGAQEQARAAGNDTITVSHLVAALVADEQAPVARLISDQGVDVHTVRRTALATLPAATDTIPKLIPFDAHARRALELTFAVAGRLDADTISPEHILLAVLEAEDGTGVLAGLGVDEAAINEAVAGAAAP